MFWTLYVIVSIGSSADKTYIEVESFDDRITCEYAINSRVILIDERYKLEFSCLRTDEAV